jgi:hypothetical protein
LGLHSTDGTTMTIPLRTLGLGLLLVTGVAQAGLFSRKEKPAPPPPPPPAPVVVVPPPPPPPPIPLEFSGIQTAAPMEAPLDRLQSASADVLDTVQWVAASKDNKGLPFVVVDKANARVYAFTPAAQLKATAPALLGGGVGDQVLVSPDAPMSAIPVQKRITPAGRYPSRLVIDNHGKTVLLIDGPNLITMHIVAKGTPVQRRAERLASVTSDDNRVSFGCINVPPAFFTTVLDPDFRPRQGIVYVLPEKTTPAQMFGFQPRAVAPPLPQALLTAAEFRTSQVAAPDLQLSPMAAPVTQAAPMTAQASPMAVSVTQAAPMAAQASPMLAPMTQAAPMTAQASPMAAPVTQAVPMTAQASPMAAPVTQAAPMTAQASPMLAPMTQASPLTVEASPMSVEAAPADPSAVAN